MGLFEGAAGLFPLQTAATLVGDIGAGLIGQAENNKARNQQDEMLQRQYEMQKEFAQMGIRWKVEDAKAAGIHPLVALGASTQGYSPTAVIGEVDHSMSDMSQRLGQDLSRAFSATSTSFERAAERLKLENLATQNELLKEDLRAKRASNPPMPLPVAGSSNFNPSIPNQDIMVVPSRQVQSARGRAAQEAGWTPDVAYSRTDTGMTPVIPQGLSESLEDDTIGKLMWRFRNQLIPNFSGRGAPPNSQLPSWANTWRWDTFKQEWQPYGAYGKIPLWKQLLQGFRYRRAQ